MDERYSLPEMNKHLDGLLKHFVPNNECPAPETDPDSLCVLEYLDLDTLPKNSLVLLRGNDSGSNYIIRISKIRSKKVVDIWKRRDTNGFRSTIENIVSIIPNPGGSFVLRNGILVNKRQFVMPYFKYDGNSLMAPESIWKDYIASINVQQPKPSPKPKYSRNKNL